MLIFKSPYFFLLILIIPFLLYHFNKINPFFYSSSLKSVLNIKSSFFIKTLWIPYFFKVLGILLVIISLARPQFIKKHEFISSGGINIVLAVDISESMQALDFKKNGKTVERLYATKEVIKDFVSKRKGDRIGLVFFSSSAYTRIPLTTNYESISHALDNIDANFVGKLTAIGDAIGISLKRLDSVKSKSNIIVLLTDGENNAGELSPEDGALLAKKRGVKIYTIGVGKIGKAPFLVNDPVYGQKYVYHEVNIDEPALQKISQITDGLYFKADDTIKLEEIYKQIDAFEKTEIIVETFNEYKDCYLYFVVAAFFIFIFEMILSNTRYLRIP
ncbi:MAG: VWA domain-containing protein [Desulfobacterales bacterium]|nr:VWA domain-containing protein [Desulfobacterales bacterium]